MAQELGRAENLAISQNEEIVVGSRFAPDRCVEYPDRPGVCHTQIWQLVAWRSDSERILAEATQPVYLVTDLVMTITYSQPGKSPAAGSP